MKKRIGSAVCAAVFAAVITFACIGAEPAEASNRGTTSDQEDRTEIEVDFYGPYLMETVDGESCFECDVWNDSDEDIYIGITYYLYDSSGKFAEMIDTYSPCVAPDDGVSLYATDYNGVYENNGSVAYMITYSYASENIDSAAADLDKNLSCTEENGYIEFTVDNPSPDTIYMPEITVVFYSADNSQYWVSSAPLTNTTTGLESGSSAVIDVPAPQGYYDWYYSLGGFYTTTFVAVDAEDADSGFTSADGSQIFGN